MNESQSAINLRSAIKGPWNEFSSFLCSLTGINPWRCVKNEDAAAEVHNGSEFGEIINNRKDITKRYSKWCWETSPPHKDK